LHLAGHHPGAALQPDSPLSPPKSPPPVPGAE
jgi:hypothetical protein